MYCSPCLCLVVSPSSTSELLKDSRSSDRARSSLLDDAAGRLRLQLQLRFVYGLEWYFCFERGHYSHLHQDIANPNGRAWHFGGYASTLKQLCGLAWSSAIAAGLYKGLIVTDCRNVLLRCYRGLEHDLPLLTSTEALRQIITKLANREATFIFMHIALIAFEDYDAWVVIRNVSSWPWPHSRIVHAIYVL